LLIALAKHILQPLKPICAESEHSEDMYLLLSSLSSYKLGSMLENRPTLPRFCSSAYIYLHMYLGQALWYVHTYVQPSSPSSYTVLNVALEYLGVVVSWSSSLGTEYRGFESPLRLQCCRFDD
jgi:hypothetical protein